jgi:hypothetical protein
MGPGQTSLIIIIARRIIMARIIVQSFRDLIGSYDTADKWVIDDTGRLHIVGPNGNLASFHQNEWASVEFAPTGS